ncbi:MAG: hypothetical protein KDK50_03795 [Chlamydiia bacterium]|nr:hypothetical protein [Chlamydiia bacterium]
MKITDYLSVKSACKALEAVRGRMPSTETAKSWVVEPITSAWNKPAGKAVFIAAGFMATLAIAFKAVKSIQGFFKKRSEAKLVSMTQAKYGNCSVDALRNACKNTTEPENGTLEEKLAVFRTLCSLLEDALKKETRATYAESSLKDLQDALAKTKDELSETSSIYDEQDAQTVMETLEAMIKERQALEKQAAE